MKTHPAGTPTMKMNNQFTCPGCGRTVDEVPLAVVVVMVTQTRKTKIHPCIECLLGSEALNHPAITEANKVAEMRRAQRQERHDQQRKARMMSRFSNPDSPQLRKFVDEGTPAAKALEPTVSAFVPVDGLSEKMQIPDKVVEKLIERLSVDIIEIEGVPSVSLEDIEEMEMEVRRAVAAKNQKKNNEKYADQIESTG